MFLITRETSHLLKEFQKCLTSLYHACTSFSLYTLGQISCRRLQRHACMCRSDIVLTTACMPMSSDICNGMPVLVRYRANNEKPVGQISAPACLYRSDIVPTATILSVRYLQWHDCDSDIVSTAQELWLVTETRKL